VEVFKGLALLVAAFPEDRGRVGEKGENTPVVVPHFFSLTLHHGVAAKLIKTVIKLTILKLKRPTTR
jgi:hypothetical protein